jgi:signal transduction histidine kinase
VVTQSRPSACSDSDAGQSAGWLKAQSSSVAASSNRLSCVTAPRTATIIDRPSASIDDVRELGTNTNGAGLPVSVEIATGVELLTGSVVAAIHRIAQEAVSNANRHAVDASGIDVSVRVVDDDALVVVSNDGAITSHRRNGFGLIGIDERVRELGGTCTAGPQVGGGWSVAACLPVRHVTDSSQR